MIYEHVHCFKSNTKLAYCWLAVFNLRWELGVNNALMVAEICLFNPLSNVESKLFFMEKLCQRKIVIKNESMENILHLHENKDFSEQQYCRAIKYFWSNIQMIHFDREVIT